MPSQHRSNSYGSGGCDYRERVSSRRFHWVSWPVFSLPSARGCTLLNPSRATTRRCAVYVPGGCFAFLYSYHGYQAHTRAQTRRDAQLSAQKMTLVHTSSTYVTCIARAWPWRLSERMYRCPTQHWGVMQSVGREQEGRRNAELTSGVLRPYSITCGVRVRVQQFYAAGFTQVLRNFTRSYVHVTVLLSKRPKLNYAAFFIFL